MPGPAPLSPDSVPARRDLLTCYQAALAAVGGRGCVARFLRRRPPPAPVRAVALGKAAVHMAAGAFEVLGGDIESALLLTKHGHCEPLLPPGAPARCMESAHPVPDRSSLAAGRALLAFVEEAPREAALLFLLSGGASSLAEVLPAAVGAASLPRINRWLLASGLPIGAINRVRKRISCIKAGRLAAHLGGRRTFNLLISDVPGDDPRVIGSGPLVAHRPADIDIGDIDLPPWLAALAAQAPALPDAGVFESVTTEIVARPADAREAAATAARARGYGVRVEPGLVVGDAVEAGRRLARDALAAPPGLYVYGSETTVRLPEQPGRGGRCQSLALAAAMEIRGRGDVHILAAGTDGTDGPGEDAGALVDGATLRRGTDAGLDPARCLAEADAGRFLAASGDLLHTGPTGTNVMDLVLVLRSAPQEPGQGGPRPP